MKLVAVRFPYKFLSQVWHVFGQSASVVTTFGYALVSVYCRVLCSGNIGWETFRTNSFLNMQYLFLFTCSSRRLSELFVGVHHSSIKCSATRHATICFEEESTRDAVDWAKPGMLGPKFAVAVHSIFLYIPLQSAQVLTQHFKRICWCFIVLSLQYWSKNR